MLTDLETEELKNRIRDLELQMKILKQRIDEQFVPQDFVRWSNEMERLETLREMSKELEGKSNGR